MSLPTAIGFDLGDTLCEYAGVSLSWDGEYPLALAAVAKRCEQELTEERLTSGIRLLSRYNTRLTPREQEREYAAEHIFEELLTEWGSPRECLAASISEFFGHFRQTLRAFPESAGVLHRLHEHGVPTGILTDVPYGMPRALVVEDLSLAALPISSRRLLTSTTVGHRKPHPAGFMALADELGVSCDRLIYIGNERKDVEGANAAGCGSVLVWRAKREPPAWGQAFTIRSLEQLFNLPLTVP